MSETAKDLRFDCVDLRESVLKKLSSINPQSPPKFTHLFDEYIDGVDKSLVLKTVIDVAKLAQPSNHWGHDDFVTTGPFDNESSFYTLYFHEITHAVLSALKKRNIFEVDYNWEEDFCYRVSENICRELNLPYNHKLAEIGLQFNTIDSSPESDSIISALAVFPEARILGFNMRMSTDY